MGHMQPTYGPVTDNTCPTAGGKTTIVQGNEALVIPMHEKMACVSGDLSNEDDSNCQGVYRRADYAGS